MPIKKSIEPDHSKTGMTECLARAVVVVVVDVSLRCRCGIMEIVVGGGSGGVGVEVAFKRRLDFWQVSSSFSVAVDWPLGQVEQEFCIENGCVVGDDMYLLAGQQPYRAVLLPRKSNAFL